MGKPVPDKIWAPWRLEYILDPEMGPGKARECPFCHRKKQKSTADDKEALILSRGNTCFTVLNKFPYANGHLMIVPYDHIDDLQKLPQKTTEEMMVLTQQAAGHLQSVFHAEGLNIGMNVGRAAGAGIPGHIHMHIVPRWMGDTNFMPVIGDVRVLPEYVEKTYDRLIGAFQS